MKPFQLVLITLLVQCGGRERAPSQRALMAIDDDCEMKGFTARSVLSRYPAQNAGLAYESTYKPGMAHATVELVYSGGNISCEPSYFADPQDKYPQPTQLVIDVDVRLTTTDGWFDVVLSGTLDAIYRSPSTRAYLDTVKGVAATPANGGSYKSTLDQYWIEGSFGPDPGALSASVGEQRGDRANRLVILSLCAPVMTSSCN